jgi:hypothetical protein
MASRPSLLSSYSLLVLAATSPVPSPGHSCFDFSLLDIQDCCCLGAVDSLPRHSTIFFPPNHHPPEDWWRPSTSLPTHKAWFMCSYSYRWAVPQSPLAACGPLPPYQRPNPAITSLNIPLPREIIGHITQHDLKRIRAESWHRTGSASEQRSANMNNCPGTASMIYQNLPCPYAS